MFFSSSSLSILSRSALLILPWRPRVVAFGSGSVSLTLYAHSLVNDIDLTSCAAHVLSKVMRFLSRIL